MRRALTAFLRFMLRMFFRRIEIVGLDRVPGDTPVIFAANHPNGLVDPLFILCFAPRPVSFLAKAPLFRYPLIGYFVRVLDSIPVYRKQDKSRGSNAETFSRARDVLRRGGSIAIFPEGTTHSDPQLRELKTGAARIALGAEMQSIAIIPAGIYYTAKQTFRSDALVWFGDPLMVSAIPIGEGGEPPADAVVELTAKIEAQLDSVTLQADSHAALELIERAELAFSGDEEQSLAARFELRKRFADGYHFLREHDPERLNRLASIVTSFRAPRSARNLGVWALLLPIAAIGVVTHFIPYKIIDSLSKRFSRDADEMTATIKFIAALLFYPLTWSVITYFVWRTFGSRVGVATMVVLPLLGYVALWVTERLDEFIGSISGTGAEAGVVSRRQRLRDEIVSVAGVINSSAR